MSGSAPARPHLTIIAIPKAFKGQFESIQLNAIESWTRLDPRPEIILFGDDEGTAEVARRFGLRHVPAVERNEYGTPLMPGVFLEGQRLAANSVICYVNSDIILRQDFIEGALRVTEEFDGSFLGVGRKTSLPIKTLLSFNDENWSAELGRWARSEGEFVTYDSDFFLFRRGTYASIPKFAIGRCYWSSWLMFDARRRGIPMIDMTPSVVTVEPRHDYSHALSTGGTSRLHGVEFRLNRRLFRGCRYYTTVNASHRLVEGAVVPAPSSNHLLSAFVRSEYYVYFLLKGVMYPYSIPLILAARYLRAGALAVRSLSEPLVRRLA